MKKLLAAFLCIVMCLSFLPAAAFADGTVAEAEDQVPVAEMPAEEPVEEPAEEPAEEPVEEPAEEPAEEPVEEPAEEPVEEPAEEPAEEPVEEPTEEPAEDVVVEVEAEEPEDPLAQLTIIPMDGEDVVFTQDMDAGYNGWYQSGSNWYYYVNGSRVRNSWLKLNGTWYAFDSSGVMLKNQVAYLRTGSSTKYFYYAFKSSGAMACNEWYKTGSEWMYLTGNGTAVQNAWKKIGGSWYYFGRKSSSDSRDYLMYSGEDNIWTISGKEYIFRNSGAMFANSWIKASYNGTNYYFYATSDGSLASSSWQKVGGKWYYFDSNGIMYFSKILTIGGEKYFFASDGHLYTNCWIKDISTGKWYAAERSGALMRNKWLKDGGSWYYFGSDCVMVKNTYMTINGIRYHFNSSGVCTNP